MRRATLITLSIAVPTVIGATFWVGMKSRDLVDAARDGKKVEWSSFWDTRPKKRVAKSAKDLLARPMAVVTPAPTPTAVSLPPEPAAPDEMMTTPIDPATLIPPACEDQWKAFAETELDDLLREIQNNDLPVELSDACAAEESTRFPESTLFHYNPRCQTLLTSATSPERSPEDNAQYKACLTSLVSYRSRVIDELTGRDAPLDELSAPVLMNKLHSRAIDGLDSNENLDRMLDITQNLIQREPDLYTGYKSKATLLLLKAQANGITPDETEVNDALEACADFDTRDPQVDELRLVRHQMSGDSEALEQEIDDALRRDPESAIAYYYKADMLFAAGDTTGATRYLRHAYQLNPRDKRVQETMERMRSPTPGEKVFRPRITLELDDN